MASTSSPHTRRKFLSHASCTAPADYLHLVNDSRGIGVQNTQIAAGGYYVVDGFVDEFDFSKTDAENEAAEFLVWYGSCYPLDPPPC